LDDEVYTRPDGYKFIILSPNAVNAKNVSGGRRKVGKLFK